jgi:hypothetical protein
MAYDDNMYCMNYFLMYMSSSLSNLILKDGVKVGVDAMENLIY